MQENDRPPIKYFGATDRWGIRQIADVWSARELLFRFFQRDLLIRYRQVVIGILWVLLQPMMGAMIFVGLFYLLDTNPSAGDVAYPVTILIGMLCWQMVSSSLRDATGSLVNYRHVVTKIYFPRLLLPLSGVRCGVFDFLIGSVLLIPLIAFTQTVVQWHTVLLCIPVFLWLIAFCIGCIAWLAPLNALYRDVGYALPFALQIGMFVSPIVYDLEKATNRMSFWGQLLYEANPVATCVSLMRWALVGSQPPSLPGMAAAMAVTVLLLLGGLAWFRYADQQLADRI